MRAATGYRALSTCSSTRRPTGWTIVATIFLPLTFLTGFFGMNFEWMIGQVDTALGFWLLGVGGCAAAVLLILDFLRRQGAVGSPPDRPGR